MRDFGRFSRAGCGVEYQLDGEKWLFQAEIHVLDSCTRQ